MDMRLASVFVRIHSPPYLNADVMKWIPHFVFVSICLLSSSSTSWPVYDFLFSWLPFSWCCRLSHTSLRKRVPWSLTKVMLHPVYWSPSTNMPSVVYFDIKHGDEDLGRIVIGLYGKVKWYSSSNGKPAYSFPVVDRLFPRPLKTLEPSPPVKRDSATRAAASIVSSSHSW